MKHLSRRTQNLEQSDIRAVTSQVKRVNGINLGQGICDLPTPVEIRQGAREAIAEGHSIYSHYAGIEELRRAILGKSQSFNNIPASSTGEVMVSVGSTGAFVCAMMALIEPEDEVILFEPFYGYHRNLLTITGATQRVITLRGRDWLVDFDEIKAAISPRTKAIVLNTPSNPCGKVWTREELRELAGIAQQYDLYVITDEIYEYMTYDGREHISMASLPDMFERTITLSGFSKTFNMTGWRLGYAVGREDIIEKMGLLSDLFYICAPTPLQHGVARSFTSNGAYYERMLEDYTQKRSMMCEALEDAGFNVPWPQGAYYVLADYSPLRERLSGFDDDASACETLIEMTGVGTVPGNSFFEHPESGRDYLRFCFAKEFDVLEEACERLRNRLEG